jgi:hypothetical protein
MAKPVTDPALLAALEAVAPAAKPVTDPKLLEQLEGGGAAAQGFSDPMGSSVAAPAAAAPSMGYSDQMRRVGSAVDDAVRALANGVTFGLMDRAASVAGAATGIGGDFGDYAGNLEKQRAETETFHNAHPILATGTNLVGSAVVPIGALVSTARALSLGGKSLLGGLTGAGLGGVQGAAESKDWTDPAQTAKDAAIGSLAGLAIGGTLPGAGKLIGSGVEKVANAIRGKAEGITRPATGHLVSAMEADTPAAVRSQIDRLGPDAMLADTGPAMLGKAQGASLSSDEGRTILQNALTDRNTGTNQRIMTDVNRALGPAEDPQTVTNAIRAHRAEVDALHYPAALDKAPPVETAPILQQLDGMIAGAPVGSMENKALSNLKEMMLRKEKKPLLDAEGYPQYDKFGNERFRDVPVSENDASILHKVKGELDNVIEYDAPGLGVPAGALQRQQGALKHLRGELNDALEAQVPGYLLANRQSAALARRGTAVDLGTQYLGAGKTTASPGRFADEFTKLEPGEQIAFAKGSRGNIERALGTKANDLQALKTELQGEGGWNTAKIAAVHGDDAAADLVATVDRNLKFRDTYNKVVENSQTAQRTAAKDAMKPTPSTETPFLNPNSTLTGMAVTGVKKVAQAALNALTRSDPTRSYGEIANILSAQGLQRDRYFQAIVDAMGRRTQNQAIGEATGDKGALATAIIANAMLRDHTQRKQQ